MLGQILFGDGSKRIRAITPDQDYTVFLSPYALNSSGGGSTVTQTVNDTTGVFTLGTQTTFGVDVNVGPIGLDYEISTSTPGILQIDGTRVLPVGAGGSGLIHVRAAQGERAYRVIASKSDTAITVMQETLGFVEGSYAKHITDSIAGYTARMPTPNINSWPGSWTRFTDTNYLTRNPSFWGSDLDFSCVTTTPNRLPATMVHPEFCISAAHVQWVKGDVMRFQLPDGTNVDTTVVNRWVISEDLCLTQHSPPVTGVQVAQVLPSDWSTKLPSLQAYAQSRMAGAVIPALSLALETHDYKHTASRHLRLFYVSQLVGEYVSNSAISNPAISRSSQSYQPIQSAGAWLDNAFGGYSWQVESGDSSSPLFFPNVGRLVLLGAQYSYGISPNLTVYAPQTNAQMNSASPGASLSVADLSPWSSY